ncbi:MAG: alanine dehydrogenase [Chloroflexi bacterium]|nr:alanine dehydrogenase [Chloroflexota bacterium]
MEFGVPREVRDLETRVGLTTAGVLALVQAGHVVYVERDAGTGAGFRDEDYRQAGAQIVYSAAEVYGRSDVVAKVTRPTAAEHQLFRPYQTIASFIHLEVASPDLFQALAEREITAIAYETIEDPQNGRPVLRQASEVAGRMAPIIAGRLLRSDLEHPRGQKGLGILLSGIPGIPAAPVVVVGAGVLGKNAALAFMGLGAEVTVLDTDMSKLQRLYELSNGRITTMISNKFNLRRVSAFADVLVGAVSTSGKRSPLVITKNMVQRMRPGSVIIDFSIDGGGCVETSRPTTLRDSSFVAEGVIHHCVPNITAAFARTTSYAITNAALPYLLAIGEYGILGATKQEPALIPGINIYQGKLSQANIAAALGKELKVQLSDQK